MQTTNDYLRMMFWLLVRKYKVLTKDDVCYYYYYYYYYWLIIIIIINY
jgi:hypothetical protein